MRPLTPDVACALIPRAENAMVACRCASKRCLILALSAKAVRRHDERVFAGGAKSVSRASTTRNVIVVPTIITARTRKAVGKDATLQILGKGLAHIGLGRAVVALSVKLAYAGQLQPCLVVLGHRLIQQRRCGAGCDTRLLQI